MHHTVYSTNSITTILTALLSIYLWIRSIFSPASTHTPALHTLSVYSPADSCTIITQQQQIFTKPEHF